MGRLRKSVSSIVVIGALVAGCGGETALDGPTIYANQCARCHGSEGQGGSGPALDSGGRLTGWEEAEIREVIRRGVRGTAMPGFQGLSELQVDNLVLYLKQLP